MYKVYGDILSGNCYKIKLMMSYLEVEHEWLHVDIIKGETHSDKFKKLNTNMRCLMMAARSQNRMLFSIISPTVLHFFRLTVF